MMPSFCLLPFLRCQAQEYSSDHAKHTPFKLSHHVAPDVPYATEICVLSWRNNELSSFRFPHAAPNATRRFWTSRLHCMICHSIFSELAPSQPLCRRSLQKSPRGGHKVIVDDTVPRDNTTVFQCRSGTHNLLWMETIYTDRKLPNRPSMSVDDSIDHV